MLSSIAISSEVPAKTGFDVAGQVDGFISEIAMCDSCPLNESRPNAQRSVESDTAKSETVVSWSGLFGMEQRLFSDKSSSADFRWDASMIFEPRFDLVAEWGELVIQPFLRVDWQDEGRTHLDIREFRYKGRMASTYLTIGVNKVFWGVTESVHLVDFLNQDDLLEDIDGEDKLGQPMIEVVYPLTAGELSAYILAGFREAELPGPGRRPGSSLDVFSTTYESGAEDAHVDLALRWFQLIGPWDISLSYFDGTSRDPVLVPTSRGLLVHYPLVERWGATAVGVVGGWLWKMEAVSQKGGSDHTATVAGFEYTLYDVFNSGVDVGIATEYANDSRTGLEAVGQNDAFLGIRLTFNDPQATRILIGGLWDLTHGSGFFTLEGSRRFGQAYRGTVEARLFDSISEDDALYPLRSESFIRVEIARYF